MPLIGRRGAGGAVRSVKTPLVAVTEGVKKDIDPCPDDTSGVSSRFRGNHK